MRSFNMPFWSTPGQDIWTPSRLIPWLSVFAQNRDLTPDEYQQAQNLTDVQRFNFRSPGGLLFFPGSASFAELPPFHGIPLLLIEKKLMTIQWDQPRGIRSCMKRSIPTSRSPTNSRMRKEKIGLGASTHKEKSSTNLRGESADERSFQGKRRQIQNGRKP